MCETIGHCYRYPPAIMPAADPLILKNDIPPDTIMKPAGIHVFDPATVVAPQTRPTVKEDDFCGEYKQKPLKANDGWCKSCLYLKPNKEKDINGSGKEGTDDNDSL